MFDFPLFVIAPKKFNYNEWDLDEYTEIETGNDDFIYGNYIDWDRFRECEEENLLFSFEIYLPFGKILTLEEYVEFLTQEFCMETELISQTGFNDCGILEQCESIIDLQIRFPERDNSNSENMISGILDYYEVPSGTDYEFDLPEELQYWSQQNLDEYYENEYISYLKYPIKFASFIENVEDIKYKVSVNTDVLIKKSLILSSCIICESLLKSAISANIPKEDNISEFGRKNLQKTIDKQLRGTVENRNSLFKDIFKLKPPKQDWLALRNALAHDIEIPVIHNEQIEYTNLKTGENCSLRIDDLFEMQIDFFRELKSIIDNFVSE